MKTDRLDPTTLAGNPRATLNQWKRYENYVMAAFKMHPRPYILEPTSMTAGTFVSRIRDAVRGCLAFGYDCAVPLEDLLRWYSEVIFKPNGAFVYIGPPQEVSEAIQGKPISSSDVTSGYSFPVLTFEEVAAFSVLLSAGRLNGPVLITQPPDLSLLPDYPNVEKIARPDGSVILL